MKKLKNFLALVIATSLFMGSGSVMVYASETKTILSLTGKSGVNLNKSLGRIEITHPNSVVCAGVAGTSNACVFNVSVQIENVSVLGLQIDLVTGGGSKVGSFTISSSVVTTVYANVSTNTAIYYVMPSNHPTVSARRDVTPPTNLVIQGTPDLFDLNAKYRFEPLDHDSTPISAMSKLVFAQYLHPLEIDTSGKCVEFPYFVGAVDYFTGKPASADLRKDITFTVSVRNPDGSISMTRTLSENQKTWSSGSTTELNLKACGLNEKTGEYNLIEVEGEATLIFQGSKYTVPFSSSIGVMGITKFVEIVCVKGTTAKFVSARTPVCPKGWKKSNIVVKDGIMQKSTIRCVKGLTVRKVTAVVPVCPSGYRRG